MTVGMGPLLNRVRIRYDIFIVLRRRLRHNLLLRRILPLSFQ